MNSIQHDSFHMGVKALIFNDSGNVLLLERDHPIKKRYWDLPGGRLQKGETLEDTLLREIKEETGLEGVTKLYPFITVVSNIRIPISEKEDVGLIFSVFRCHLSNSFDPILSAEHIHFGWFTPEAAALKLNAQYPHEFIDKLACANF